MGKKIYKISNPLTGMWDAPSNYQTDIRSRPFAIIQESNGYKKIKQVGEVREPDKMLDFKMDNGMGIPSPFKLVKRRLLGAVVEWIGKGWITKDDLAEVGLEPKETRVDGFKFLTRISEHTIKRKVDRSREKFDL